MKTGIAGGQRRERETVELVSAVRRLVRAIGKRAATDDVETLVALVSCRGDLDAAIVRAVAGLRSQEVTWQQIGDATGTTRQAAIMKWAPRLADLEGRPG